MEVIALIFDMDGVIVDSTPIHTEAWRVYLERLGLSAENIGSRMLGKHNSDLVRDLFAHQPLTDEIIYEHGARKEELYRTMMSPVLEQYFVPGVREFILRHREKPLAVASNAEPANVDFVLDQAGMRPSFRAVISGYQVARPKPFPDIYLEAAKRLDCAPSQCVVFEDSSTGVQAARAAGAKVVGVTTTLAEIPNVDFTIRDFLDPAIEPWLQELVSSS